MIKYCSQCDKDLFFSAFGRDKNKKSGLKDMCKVCRNKENRERRRKDPSKYRVINLAYARSARGKYNQWSNNLRRKFWPHLTNEQAVEIYNALLAHQNDCCGVCGKHKSEFSMRLAVDHCRTTKHVRGLLCNKCNRFEVGRHTVVTATQLVVYLQQAETESFIIAFNKKPA